MSSSQEAYVSREHTIRDDLAKLLRKEVPNSCFIQLHDKKPFVPKEKAVCPSSPSEIAKKLDHPCSIQDLKQAMRMSTQDKEQLQQATIQQSNSPDWLSQRIGRITASKFRSVYTRMQTLLKDPKADPKPLIKSLMGYRRPVQTVAMKHGLAMEPHAKKAYTKLQAQIHNKFSAQDSGLVVCSDEPILAASPDLLVTCQCSKTYCQGEPGLCEIKCPESINDQVPSAENWPGLVQVDGKTKLSETSPYYGQIQGQMAILGRSYCDFFVFTSHGHHLERIAFNQEYWDEMKPLLVHFWEAYIAPELMFGTIANDDTPMEEIVTDHSYARTCPDGQASARDIPSSSSNSKGPLSKPKIPLVFMCGVCMDDIANEPMNDDEESVECTECKVWFHKLCARVQLSNVDRQKAWMCLNCTA